MAESLVEEIRKIEADAKNMVNHAKEEASRIITEAQRDREELLRKAKKDLEANYRKAMQDADEKAEGKAKSMMARGVEESEAFKVSINSRISELGSWVAQEVASRYGPSKG